jgi:site-specific recombinase XerD
MKHIDDYLEPERVNAMLDAANACSSRDYLMLRILWRSGIRVSELVNIRLKDIEWDNCVVNILKAKGGKQRRVLLDSETISSLSRYVSDTELGDENCLFPLTRRHVWHLVKKYGRMVGVDVHPHTLRHSYAINMIRNGVDIRRVQLLLGHAGIQTTTVYLQFKDADLREVYDKVEF